MFFYGWIPHLASSLEALCPIEEMEHQMSSTANIVCVKNNHNIFDFDIKTHKESNDNSKVMKIMFRMPKQMKYSGPKPDVEPILAYVHNIRKPIEARIWIEDTGMVHIEAPDVNGIEKYDNDGSLDIQRMMRKSEETYSEYNTIRDYCKEIFFKIKTILHGCTRHDFEDEKEQGYHNDMYFAMSHMIQREMSIGEISRCMMKNIQNELEYLQISYKKIEKMHDMNIFSNVTVEDEVFHEHFCHTMGHITHGWSFLHKFKDSIPGCDWTRYGNALVQYEGSVKTLYEAHVNMDNRQLNSTIKLLTMATVAIGAITAMTGIIL